MKKKPYSMTCVDLYITSLSQIVWIEDIFHRHNTERVNVLISHPQKIRILLIKYFFLFSTIFLLYNSISNILGHLTFFSKSYEGDPFQAIKNLLIYSYGFSVIMILNA